MFQSLSDRLASVFDGLKRTGNLREDDVAAAMREIRVALLEADVALPVVKDFIARVQEKAVGQTLIKGVTPAQQVVKIVHDEMVVLLGSETVGLRLDAAPPVVYLMVGLQGSGKTTTSAKIGYFLTQKSNKKVLMASLDVQRPAAQEQLRQLGVQTNIATLPIVAGQDPIAIAKRAYDTAKIEGYDVVILDTAGRLSIDEKLMAELAAIRDTTKPLETLLVADSMLGQDAVNTAKAFHDQIGVTGIVLTRVDGDARGGAAMSMHAVTGQPIKLLGTGEKWDALEPFHPDRIVSRILGMGDVVSLVERAVEQINVDDAAAMAAKFQSGKFDFNDMLSQFSQMKKMGGVSELMKMLPGLSRFSGQIDEAKLDSGVMKHQEAIILSMTKAERSKPSLLNASRKKRIAAGSGTSVQDINRLVKQYEQMETVMRKMRKMGTGGMLGAMKSLMGAKDNALLDAYQQDPQQNIGPGSFPSLPAGLSNGLPGLGGGLPGLGAGMNGFNGLFNPRGGKSTRKK
ncbi:MAG: signal recognition particle protein [Pseudomonadota bacterium]